MMMMNFLFRSLGLIIVTESHFMIFPEYGIILAVIKIKLLLADNCAKNNKKSSLVNLNDTEISYYCYHKYPQIVR